MIEPTGYTALDLVGFTDRGTYAANVNYVKNDLVHYGGNIWRILIDDTIGITPAEGPNYTLFIGEPINLVERIIAPLEDNPATVAYQTGRQIIYNDHLYEVIQNIGVGDTLIAYEDDPTNANIKLASPVETQVLALNASKVNKSDVVNNVTTTAKGKVLDARQGKALQDGINTKVNKSDIANNVMTTAEGKVLDARQGKALQDGINTKVNTSDVVNNTTTTTAGKVLDARQGKALQDAINTKVNTSDIANNVTTTAAGKVLDARQGKALQDGINTKVNTSDVVNNVTTTAEGKVLDARQGKALQDGINTKVNTSDVVNNTTTTTAGKVLDARQGKALQDGKTDNSVIAPVESGTTASRAYAAGAHFIKNGAFCTAKTAIAQGETFTLNTNYTASNIGQRLYEEEDFLKTLRHVYRFKLTSGSYTSGTDIPIVNNYGNDSKIYAENGKIIFKKHVTALVNVFIWTKNSNNRSWISLDNVNVPKHMIEYGTYTTLTSSSIEECVANQQIKLRALESINVNGEAGHDMSYIYITILGEY